MESKAGNASSSAVEVEKWSVEDVNNWLLSQGLSHLVEKFQANAIDGFTLLRLTEEDLRQEPVRLNRLGDIKHTIEEINKLAPTRHRLVSPFYKDLTSSYHDVCNDENVDGFNHRRFSQQLRPERFKTLVAALYAWVVVYICALIMTVVNERVPDMEKYPPLPDVFLDNVPYIPWAFQTSEYIALGLAAIFALIVLSHKHRSIIMRRFFSLAGTLYLLRGVCMLITSLSVPCKFFQCQRHVDADLPSKLKRAWDIVCAGGMSVNGVRYCGDYMFSGHTTTLTLLALFIDEYSDKNYPIVKTLCWVLNLFGIFFIMAGHEHYSIDVFIAFYLTTRLFLYYHTLADNKAQLCYDERKVRVWFPLFSYFESEINGAVPHEYGWPISIPHISIRSLWPSHSAKAE